MAINDNLIQRMEFQIQIDEVSQFDLLAKEIPSLVAGNLEDFLDRSMQNLGLDRQFLIIERLVLDLGRLDISNLKYELQEQFKLQFLGELEKHLSKNKFTKIPDGDLTFFIYIYFIKNGARPWWLNNQIKHFREFAAQAFLLQPHKFVSYFKLFIKSPSYRKRILDHLPEELFIEVLMHEKKIDRIISSKTIFSIQDFLKKKYRYWNEDKISLEFKEIILRLILYGHPIDQAWKLNLAIETALETLPPHGLKWSGLSGTSLPSPDQPERNRVNRWESSSKNPTRGMTPSRGEEEVFLQWFQFYLENGYSHPAISAKFYSHRAFNYLFKYLVVNQLELVTSLLLSLGKDATIKKRFLGSISQDLLDQFFSMIAPSKRKLMEWVVDVYQKVQEDYRPINQTFINVKKSINEITFELFLNKKLNKINDENYLRFLFKQSSKKFGVKYQDLLFFTLKSLASTDKRYQANKFYETLSAIYTKDILKSSVYFSGKRSVVDWNQPEPTTQGADYRSKEFVYDLFLSVSGQKQSGKVRLAGDWLKSQLESQSIDDTADVLRLWEVFAAKFGLHPEQVLIGILVEKHKNPSIRLSTQAFNFWKKKYKIEGLYSRKKPDESRLIQTLQEHKKLIPRDRMKSILLGLKWSKRVEKVDLQLIVNLIHSIDSQWVAIYLTWVDKLLKKNQLNSKKSLVSNWFLHQLIVLPQKNLTLEFLQKKTQEFLQADDKPLGAWSGPEYSKSTEKAENKNRRIGYKNATQAGSLGKYSRKFTQEGFRLFEILGRSSILAIFPESNKYGDKILFQLMTSKYEAEFLKLVKKHQFNEEFQDYLLIQAPGWLKKQLLDFLFQGSLSSWSSTVSSLQVYFEKNKWIQLSSSPLLSFIEKKLWMELFESKPLSFAELVGQQLQKALAEGLISNSFWTDLSDFQSFDKMRLLPLAPSSAVQDLRLLQDSDFLSYAEVIIRRQVKGLSTIQILESLLFDSDFPKGHPFEGNQVEDFRSYIQDIIQRDRKVLIVLLDKAESPVMLLRFLRLLDMKNLRFVIQENHRKLGFQTLIKRMDAVFSFFRIKEKSMITDFWMVWIEKLYFRRPENESLPQVYAMFFRMMVEEGILQKASVILVADWKPVLSILQMKEEEGDVFLEEMGRQIGSLSLRQVEGPTDLTATSVLTMEDVESYIRRKSQIDRVVLIRLLKQVESPALLHRMLKLLDPVILRFLIQEHHRKLGLPNLLKQLNNVFSFYKITEESKIKDFFVAWIGLLYFRKSKKGSFFSLYAKVIRVLLSEGILPIDSFHVENDQKPLLTIFQLEGKEGDLFVEEFVQLIRTQLSTQENRPNQLIPVDLLRMEDFQAYIQGVQAMDREVLTGRLLSRVQSPALLLLILKTLDEKTLRFLIGQQYRKVGSPSLLNQLDSVLSFFKVTNEAKIHDFFSAWFGILHFRKIDLHKLPAHYVSMFRLLLAEGILSTASFISVTDWKPLLAKLSLAEKEQVLLVQELSKLRKIPVSVLGIDSLPPTTKDFLGGRNPIDLIYYPIGLSFTDYVSVVELLLEKGFFNKSHWPYLQEWVRFAAKEESKEYLQSVFQIYFLKNLKSTSNLRMLKGQLFYSFLDNLKQDRRDVTVFLSRLSLRSSLIQGITWLPLEGVKREVSENWKLVWSQVNGSPAVDHESADWQELIFNLFLTSGMSFFENKSELQGNLAKVSIRLERVSLTEFFSHQIHPGVFLELVKVKTATEIQKYFVHGMDAHLKTVSGRSFLFAWFGEFFKSADEVLLAKFLHVFHRSFYSNSFSEAHKLKLFTKGFFQLQGAQKGLRSVVENEMVEMEAFFLSSPEFFESIRPRPVLDRLVVLPLKIFQSFLDSGLLPKGITSLQELSKLVSELKGSDLDRLRILIHAGLQSDRNRQNFYKLLAYLDETWFLELIHCDLLDDLDELNKSIKAKVRVDFFADLRINKKLDRLIFISSQWAMNGVKLKSTVEVLQLILKKWVDMVDPQVVKEVFSERSRKSDLLIQLMNSNSKLKKIVEEEVKEDKRVSKSPIPEDIEPIDYGEGVSIANAGLILLWPFYGRFFNALGMVGREGMNGEEIRERAIQLLQYIATGLTEFEEWDLTLNKILCGANPDFPVSPRIDLTAEEKELCEKLVKGTVYNWEKMRGTRMETFRETFLQRDGRLYYKENRWELIVDIKAYDVLLDTLPWNISMINLSWMNTRITVQWR